MRCPDCDGLLSQVDSGEPDYVLLEEWYCVLCGSIWGYDDLFSDDPYERE